MRADLRQRAIFICGGIGAAKAGLLHSHMIAYLTLELRIEAAHSLKDKRQVVRSVKDGLRSHFNVAVAELDPSDAWQRATLGVVGISSSRSYLEGLMRNAERHATRVANNCGGEVVDSLVEFFSEAEIGERATEVP